MIERIVERAARRVARGIALGARASVLRLIHGRSGNEGDLESVGKIAAVRLDRLGDLVLTLPALDDLRASFPTARLLAMVRPTLAPLLRGRPSIDYVVPVPRDENAGTLALRMAAHGPDMVVDFSSVDDLLAARAAAFARVPIRVGLAGGGREVFLTRTARPSPASLPEINGAIVGAAGGVHSASSPVHKVVQEESLEAERLLRELGAPPGRLRFAIHPGGHYPSQRWPVELFASTARTLTERRGGTVVILGGPGDDAEVLALHNALAQQSVIAPQMDVKKLAAVMDRCDLLLANNSGPLHLAGAVGLPTVSVMGPTDPVRFSPVGRDQAVLRREVRCSPCTRGRCDPHDCLRAIRPDEAVEAAGKLIELSTSRRRGLETGVGA